MKLNRISRTFNFETRNKFPMHLQIFADGGDTGADGGNSGVGDGDDGSGGGEGDGDCRRIDGTVGRRKSQKCQIAE